MTPVELTQAGELLLATAQEHNCPYWLLDARFDEYRHRPDLYHWAEDYFLPRVRTMLGTPPVVAILIDLDFWRELENRGHLIDQPTPAEAFRLGWFTEEAPAYALLHQFRTLRAQGQPLRQLVAARY